MAAAEDDADRLWRLHHLCASADAQTGETTRLIAQLSTELRYAHSAEPLKPKPPRPPRKR